MQDVLEEFDERATEVNNYVNFVRDLEKYKIKIYDNNQLSKIDTELLKTLKATSYLLIYNLIESSMRNSIEYIFVELSTQQISFDDLRKELKKYILQNLKRRNIDTVIDNVNIIATDIINKTFNPNDIFSGNVDSNAIRKLSDKYFGFSTYTDSKQTWKGKDLKSIKENRNSLAHGFTPFTDVGKSIGSDELVQITERVIEYLRQILENIEEYLNNQEYLDSET